MTLFKQSMMAYAMIFSPTHIKVLQSQVYFSGEKVYASSNHMSNQKYARISEQSALKLLWNTIKIIAIISVSSAIPAMFNLYILIKDHEINLPIPILFPFTDLDSVSGFIINFLNQLLIGILGFVGTIGIEITTCLIKNTLWMMTVATSYAIDEMVEEMTTSVSVSTVWARTQIHIDYIFRNILLQAQDIDRHVQTFFLSPLTIEQLNQLRLFMKFRFRFVMSYENLFYWRILLRPLTLCFGICLAMFFYLEVSE